MSTDSGLDLSHDWNNYKKQELSIDWNKHILTLHMGVSALAIRIAYTKKQYFERLEKFSMRLYWYSMLVLSQKFCFLPYFVVLRG